MLILGSRLTNIPIMSLQTGTEIARTGQALIDPHSLRIIAYQVYGPLIKQAKLFLRIADVRELSNIGLIIDSSDELVSADDIIAIGKLDQLGFQLVDKVVISEDKRKIGKVSDYTVDVGSFVIQQLNVRRSLLSSFGDAEVLVHRSQIVEINNKQIIIRSGQKKAKAAAPVKRDYVNPFRGQPQHVQPKETDN